MKLMKNSNPLEMNHGAEIVEADLLTSTPWPMKNDLPLKKEVQAPDSD